MSRENVIKVNQVPADAINKNQDPDTEYQPADVKRELITEDPVKKNEV